MVTGGSTRGVSRGESLNQERGLVAGDPVPTVCETCGGVGPLCFRFVSADGAHHFRCLRDAIVYPPTFRRALSVAGIVGTILFIINQADVVLMGHLTPLIGFKILLTYSVPFLVSTYSALAANRVGCQTDD